MGEAIRKLGNAELETLAKIVAECMTGSQMNDIFQECGVTDTSNESTKWKLRRDPDTGKQTLDVVGTADDK